MHIKITPKWDFEDAKGEHLHNATLPLLEQTNLLGNLSSASKQCGLSYRHAWNILNKASVFFGSPLVIMEKGRGAQLTPLGQKLLWGNQRIQARLAPELESLATELNVELQRSIAQSVPIINIYASHGYAVALMTQFSDDFQVEIHYHTPQQALSALNEGRCKIAGFHQPIGLSIPAQQDLYKKLLDPKRFGIIRFVKRQQGLIFNAQNPYQINTVGDLKKGNFRFINRQHNSGTRELLDELLRREKIKPDNITGYTSEELTHSAIAAHIASGMADVGFGIEAAARRFNLGFAPVIKEYYLWAYPLQAEQDEDIQTFISALTNKSLQQQINALPGYECDDCGKIVSSDSLQ